MRLPKAPLLTATATAFLLAACGGGGPTVLGPGRTVTPSPAEVFALADRSADTTSRIGGASLRSQTNTVQTVTASLPRQTFDLTDFSLGTVTITILDDTNTGWTDENGNVLTVSPDQPSSYTFSSIFNFTQTIPTAGTSPDDFSGPVILGVLTPATGFTATGTVIYQGEAFVDGVTESGSTSFQARGVSTVTSDFNGGNVDVVINGLQNTPPFDRIEISSMSLTRSNATFGDGSVALFSGDEDVTQIILGAGYTTDASGAFFGLDSLMQSFQPDEVGGIFVGDGTNGTLSGGFLAD